MQTNHSTPPGPGIPPTDPPAPVETPVPSVTPPPPGEGGRAVDTPPVDPQG